MMSEFICDHDSICTIFNSFVSFVLSVLWLTCVQVIGSVSVDCCLIVNYVNASFSYLLLGLHYSKLRNPPHTIRITYQLLLKAQLDSIGLIPPQSTLLLLLPKSAAQRINSAWNYGSNAVALRFHVMLSQFQSHWLDMYNEKKHLKGLFQSSLQWFSWYSFWSNVLIRIYLPTNALPYLQILEIRQFTSYLIHFCNQDITN